MGAATALMRIGELAQRARISAKTIRYYESRGVLPAPRRSASGYRLYDASWMGRLAFVRKAQQLGLSLAEVVEIARLRDGGTEPCAHVIELIDAQLERAQQARKRLDDFARDLRRLRASAKRRSDRRGVVCRIIEHAEFGSPLDPTPLRRSGRAR